MRVEYDAQGRAIREYDALGRLINTITYNIDGSTSVTDAQGHTETHSYDRRNTLIGDQNALGGMTSKTYDPNFRPDTITDPNNHTTDYSYSPDGANLIQVVDAAGNDQTMTYDSLNNKTRSQDALDYSTIYTYTGKLLIAQTDPLGNTTTYTYTTSADAPQPRNLLKSQTDSLGNTARHQYDALGQSTVVTDTAGNVTTYAYDALGRVVTTTSNKGTTLEQVKVDAYDNAGRLTQTTDNYLAGQPQNYLNRYNLVTQHGYDAVGNEVAITDTLGRVTQQVYDGNNRLTQVTRNVLAGQPQNYQNQYNLVTTYTYNDLGLQTDTTDTLGRVTHTEYDELNRPLIVTSNYIDGVFDLSKPDEDIQTITQYDAAGNTIAVTRFANVLGLARTEHTGYDVLDRPTTVTHNYVDGVFDPSRPDEDVQTVTGYDANGNVTSKTEFASVPSLARVTTTAYDKLNRPVAETANYKDGVYDANHPDEDVARTIHYDSAGRVDSTTEYSNIIGFSRTTRTVFDPVGRPTSVTSNYQDGVFDPNAPATDLIHITVYGRAGERQSETDQRGGPGVPVSSVTTTYTYDNLGRQLTTTRPLTGTVTAVTSSSYDAAGRIVDSTDSLGLVTHTTYDLQDRVVSVTANYKDGVFDPARPDEDITTATQYDAAGRATCTTEFSNTPSPRTSCTVYDKLDRPVQVTQNYIDGVFDPARPAEDVIALTSYNGAGDRVSETNERGYVTTYTYDKNGHVLSMVKPLGNGAATTLYTYDARGRQVDVIDPLGHKTRLEYDGLDRTVKSTQNYVDGIYYPNYPDEDLPTAMRYDPAGNKVSSTDPNGVVTTYEYDALDRQTAVVENSRPGYPADNQTNVRTETVYDSTGNKLAVKDGNLHITTFAYDLGNRQISERDALG